MSTAMNLPDAVFGSIIRQIELRIQDECGEESALNRTFYSNEIDCLRLVGREWQAWLSERPYHRKLSITVPWRLVLLPNRLHVTVPSANTHSRIRDVCCRLTPNIKLLSIQGAGHDGRELLPVFESLRRSLEELFGTRTYAHLRFPKLRFLRIYSWPNCSLSCFVCEPMFSQAPLEVIALRLRKTEDSCLSPRFISLPHLRQLVIGPGIESLSFSWEYYLKRASTHGVECVRLPDGNQIFQRMQAFM
ncbi:hypothetical protein PSTT_09610 [Puccinia striiformis]|uniref:F-box domain-containing protein n=1 Tax=Puccinia striiformis TaxID=27350 RepID=A0A2S4V7U6_9BASI|nr:hypothetical protein PSTT_09610 [Puccinia striiformis]